MHETNYTTRVQWIYTLFFSGIVPASEYLFSAPRGLDEFIPFFNFSGIVPDSEYLFSAPRGLDEFIPFFNFSGIVPASQYLFSAPRGLDEFIPFFNFSGIVPSSEYLFNPPLGLFILVLFSPLPSIFSALLEDSKKVSFQRGFARYLLAISSTCADSLNFYDLRLFRVPAQGVEVTCVLRFNEGVFKNDVIRQ